MPLCTERHPLGYICTERHPLGYDMADGTHTDAVIRVHTEGTCPFLPPEVSWGPDPADRQCHLVLLTSIIKETIPTAPDKKCRQSLPWQ